MTDFASLPRGKYRCILADPPWAFRTFSGENMTPHRCAEDHYKTMTLDDLAALPVGEIAAPDCALFMWVVGSHLEESIALARAWGFAFKTDVFYWLKQKLIDADQIDLFTGDIADLRMGFGYWSRKQVEPCWLFTRGSPPRLSKGVRQLIVEACPDGSPRHPTDGGQDAASQQPAMAEVGQVILAPRREHSRKPDAQYERIEALVDGPRIELFARAPRAGWDSWGNQVDKFTPAVAAA